MALSVPEVSVPDERKEALKGYAQISHQILAFIASEFKKKTEQPTKSQELRTTEQMFMFFRHGKQDSARMHPKRVITVKRVSSVDGVMMRTEERKRERFRQTSTTCYLCRSLSTTGWADN